MTKKYTTPKNGFKSSNDLVPNEIINFLLNYSKNFDLTKEKLKNTPIQKN